MKKRFLIFIVTLVASSSYAQQDAQFTNYMYNTININPAYAGSRGILSVFGLHRNQWVGLDGAPVTNTFSLNTPISNSNFGIGFSVINDEIGPAVENSISVDISYTIKTSETYKLSFGLKATGNLLDVDFTKLNIFNPGDKLGQSNIDNRFSPNVGAGLFLHSDKTYFGVSVPNFLETKHFEVGQTASSLAAERLHYYFIGGHVFDVNSNIKFKPAFLTKLVQGVPLQVDLSGNFLINDKFVVGAAYRWSAAVSLLTGFQITDGLFIGYGYDFETTRLANYNSGSHEIFLRFELFSNKSRIVSPRFF